MLSEHWGGNKDHWGGNKDHGIGIKDPSSEQTRNPKLRLRITLKNMLHSLLKSYSHYKKTDNR